jgi:regulator of protease activity HflC (stomatin/prohibitin superfamily)
MTTFVGIIFGFLAWFTMRYLIFGVFTVNQNERAVKTSFGRAQRLPGNPTVDLPEAEGFSPEERARYAYPQLRVIPPGGPYFKMPWEKVYKVSVATETMSMAYDPETPSANAGGTILEAVTKDQLNTGLTGQIRYQVAERNLYAYLFGVKNPIAHVMGYFISVLREKIARFEAPTKMKEDLDEGTRKEGDRAGEGGVIVGISINDLRKNLRDINEHMIQECGTAAVRYGIELDASLITGIDPPQEVESALAAINTAQNNIESDISVARADADQTLVQSKRAVEIQTLRAQAEVEPLLAQAEQLRELKKNGGSDSLGAYLRNARLELFGKADRVFLEVSK